VYQLVIKVFNIIDARCNHDVGIVSEDIIYSLQVKLKLSSFLRIISEFKIDDVFAITEEDRSSFPMKYHVCGTGVSFGLFCIAIRFTAEIP